MSVVLDCSVTLSWYIPDEVNHRTRAVLDHVAVKGAVVPFHWRAEMVNGLLVAIRRKRVEPGFVPVALERFGYLPISVDLDGMALAGSASLALAQEHDLTAYDAIYLETAKRMHLPLATFDKALRRAAGAAGVPVFEIASP